jgi:hypothetical protein
MWLKVEKKSEDTIKMDIRKIGCEDRRRMVKWLKIVFSGWL